MLDGNEGEFDKCIKKMNFVFAYKQAYPSSCNALHELSRWIGAQKTNNIMYNTIFLNEKVTKQRWQSVD